MADERSVEQRVSEAIAGWSPPSLSGRRVTVVVPDVTRPVPYEAVVGPLVARLAQDGAALTLLVALGLHRPMTDEELRPLQTIAKRWGARVVQHDARGPDLVTLTSDLGGMPSPFPGIVHSAVANTDHLVLVGWVEPHQYAGFSGGIKTVAIGCAGEATIGMMHGLTLLRDPNTTLGVVDGNPFQKALWRMALHLPSMDALLVVPVGQKAHEVFLGPIEAVFESAVARAKDTQLDVWTDECAALSIPVPAVKAQSFYQASRAATYVALVRNSVLPNDGAVIISAACPEGLGRGAGEQAFAAALARGPDALRTELAAGDRALSGGEQRAFVLVRTLDRIRLAVVSAPPMPELAAFGVTQAASEAEAIECLGLSSAPVPVRDVFQRVPVRAKADGPVSRQK